MLIIGSRAAKHYFSDFRDPKDWDVICYPYELEKFKNLNPLLSQHVFNKHEKKWILRKPGLQIEFELAIPGSSGELLLNKVHSPDFNFNLDKCSKFPVKFDNDIYFANPEILFLIKRSHIGYQIHWDKNILDYSYLKDNVPQLEFYDLALQDFISMRANEMKDRFSKRKKINLDMKNEEFFGKTQKFIKRKYPHDMLHKFTCYGDAPIYEKIKKDINKAAVNESLWNNLSHDDKIKAVREEAFVIALERLIIPAKNTTEKVDRIVAFKWALKRISTNLTDGFFQEFALNNYHEIIKDIPKYDNKFFSKVGLAI